MQDGPASESSVPVRFHFELFVSRNDYEHEELLERLQTLFQKHLPAPFQVDTYDISKHPRRAAREKILVTPTLIKKSPGEIQRLVGDLFAGEQLLEQLKPTPIHLG